MYSGIQENDVATLKQRNVSHNQISESICLMEDDLEDGFDEEAFDNEMSNSILQMLLAMARGGHVEPPAPRPVLSYEKLHVRDFFHRQAYC